MEPGRRHNGSSALAFEEESQPEGKVGEVGRAEGGRCALCVLLAVS